MDDMACDLVKRLQGVVGHKNVLTDSAATLPYRSGYRVGGGDALAIVRPGSLVELWQTAEMCVNVDVIIIMQAANTGLTGGSVPDGNYDRPVVVISTLRIDGVMPILEGHQAVCFAGATLTRLEQELGRYGRTPHSVIGSSCIGASVVGGICNNSGGALVSRGPAFTRHSLFARIDENRRLLLVNHLGIDLGVNPIDILSALDRGALPHGAIQDEMPQEEQSDYETHVRDIAAATPSRYNADPHFHFEAAGSAGKLIVFAVRVESFPAPANTATFLLATDRAEDLGKFRRDVLSSFRQLPVSAEYMHKDAATLSASHGNDVCLAVKWLGAHRMPLLFSVKRGLDRLFRPFTIVGASFSDRLLQIVGRLAPHPLPRSIRPILASKKHLLLVTMADSGIEELRAHVRIRSPSSLVVHACTEREAAALQRVRFATAGATVRYSTLARGGNPLVAIDCALPRNAEDWEIDLPATLARQVNVTAVYGHFMCHVFHLDFVLHQGADPVAFEHELVELLHRRGIECPAEHNFGHHYRAPENVVAFYRGLDPTNTLNPGIGQTSRARNWQ